MYIGKMSYSFKNCRDPKREMFLHTEMPVYMALGRYDGSCTDPGNGDRRATLKIELIVSIYIKRISPGAYRAVQWTALHGCTPNAMAPERNTNHESRASRIISASFRPVVAAERQASLDAKEGARLARGRPGSSSHRLLLLAHQPPQLFRTTTKLAVSPHAPSLPHNSTFLPSQTTPPAPTQQRTSTAQPKPIAHHDYLAHEAAQGRLAAARQRGRHPVSRIAPAHRTT
jgi:hypothetical protein